MERNYTEEAKMHYKHAQVLLKEGEPHHLAEAAIVVQLGLLAVALQSGIETVRLVVAGAKEPEGA